ncbi:murein biosynthesis integral membrane protein MurJ [Romboutsia sp. 1001713B170131_170501_G6]|uniref:murein biosynthesis integral membrane protein MurJ n=1 Tax=Romboutsia sp. 1001713B170131_170501_G6 TaxID=2787108 RepID=UPI0018AC7716|nr:murein biosynthesis integral membrane protein MurJ [Romboutsia sp. 1001713B170131_170501_G6]
MNILVKNTIILMIITMLSKFFGFGRELILTYIYGASSISDVYITSMSIPTILFSSIGVAISTAFIPLSYEIEDKYGRNSSLNFANNIFNSVMILGIVLSLVTFVLTEPVVKLFAMDFSGERLELAIKFTRIMIFGVIFIGLSNMMTAWLQINNEFSIPGMIGYPFNICIIIGTIISSKGNLNMMAIGTLLGMASQFLLQLPFAIKKGFKYKLYIDFKDKYLRKMLGLIIPVFIGVAVNQVNAIVDRSLASTLSEGTITVLNSANRLNGFVLGLFISTIATVIYPMLAKLSNDDNKDELAKSVSTSINSVILLIIPISVGAIVLAEPVVRIIFERGAFNSQSTHMTAVALACYSIGMIGFGLREILNKVFYSLKDTKTPMINGALAVSFNIVLNLIFVKIIGYAGLALATSISAIICILLLFTSLKKKISYFGQDRIIKTMLKSMIAAIGMGIITKLAYNLLSGFLGLGFIKEAIALFGSIGIGIIVYGVLVIIFKVEEINVIIEKINKKIKI